MGAAVASIGGRRSNMTLVYLALAVVLIVGALFVIRNMAHADAKHKEAVLVRSTYKSGGCVAVEAWISLVQGKVLVLCQLPGQADLWGGMVFRFIENGSALLGGPGVVRYLDETNEVYEATCYANSMTRARWQGVITRDGYVPLGGYVDIQARFFNWLLSNL